MVTISYSIYFLFHFDFLFQFNMFICIREEDVLLTSYSLSLVLTVDCNVQLSAYLDAQ